MFFYPAFIWFYADSIRHRIMMASPNVMQLQFQNQSEFAGEFSAPQTSHDNDAESDTAPLSSSGSECHLTERQQEEMKFDMNHGGVGVCDAFRRALSHCSPISRCALNSTIYAIRKFWALRNCDKGF